MGSKAWNYLKMCTLFISLSLLILLFTGKPLIDYGLSIFNMMIIQGAPSDGDSISNSILTMSSHLGKASDDVVEPPSIGDQYGFLKQESSNFNVPLYYGDTEEILRKGAGQYTGSGFPGEGYPILISAHDVTFFAPLEQMRLGEEIQIVTESNLYTYEIIKILVASKYDDTVFDLDAMEEQLILYTCYPFGQLIGDRESRYFVIGRLINTNEKDAREN